MTPLRIRLLATACLLAALGAVSGCANFPANKPSAMETPPAAKPVRQPAPPAQPTS